MDTLPWDNVPPQLVYTFPLIGVLIGDVLGKLPKLAGWIIPANALVCTAITCWWYGAVNPSTVLLGLNLGLAATGVHRLGRQIGARP